MFETTDCITMLFQRDFILVLIYNNVMLHYVRYPEAWRGGVFETTDSINYALVEGFYIAVDLNNKNVFGCFECFVQVSFRKISQRCEKKPPGPDEYETPHFPVLKFTLIVLLYSSVSYISYLAYGAMHFWTKLIVHNDLVINVWTLKSNFPKVLFDDKVK